MITTETSVATFSGISVAFLTEETIMKSEPLIGRKISIEGVHHFRRRLADLADK
jgi:hypothetical protein